MSTATELEFLVDLDSPVCCEESTCDNEANWKRRHGSCIRLTCNECKEYIASQLLLYDDDETLWCPACEVSEPIQFWWEEIRWVKL